MLSLIKSATPSRSCRSLHRVDCRIAENGSLMMMTKYMMLDLAKGHWSVRLLDIQLIFVTPALAETSQEW